MADGEPIRLVGRDAERRTLGEFLAQVEHGPAGLLLEGPAGIGKSALWREALEEARRRGVRTLTARPSGAEASWAYQSLADLFGSVDPGIVAALPPPQRRALEVAFLEADPAAGGPAADDEAHARAVSAAATTVLLALAARGPVLVAIDDVPWLDTASRQVLTAAARRVGHRPVGFLLTQRTESPGPMPLGLGEGIATERIRLEPLTLGALHLVLVQRLGMALPRPTLARLHAMAHGNPLHALEIARALRALPALPRPGEPLPVPETLRVLQEARLEAMSPEVRGVLLHAAIAGTTTTDELGRALGPSAARAIEEAVDAGLLLIEGGVVRFTHPSLAATVEELGSGEARRAAHATLATVAPTVEGRARHLALSTLEPDGAVAASLEAAAEAARRKAAMEPATELIRLAVERTPPDDAAGRQRRSLTLASMLVELADLPAAQRVLDGLIPELPAGPTRAEAYLLAGTIAWYTETDSHPSVDRLLLALPDAEGDAELLGRIHYRLAIFHDYDLVAARHHAARAVEALRTADAPITLAGALHVLFHVTVVAGGRAQERLLDEALALEGDGTHVDMSTVPGIWWLAIDRPDLAEGRFRTMLERSRAAGETSGEADLLTRLAETALVADRYEEALRHADEAEAAALQEGQATPEPVLRIRALAEGHLGRTDEARARATAGAERARAASAAILEAAYRQTLVSIEMAAGRPDEVDRHAARSAELLEAAGWVQPLRLDVRQERVEALVALGRLDEAEALLERFEAGARIVPRPWADAAIARGRARLLAAKGDMAGAIEATSAATDDRSEGWRRLDRARTLLVRGSVLRQGRMRRTAGDALEEAVAMFEAIGARAWIDRAHDELRRLGRQRSSSDDLTPMEERVASLAAEGRRNHEVAQALGISPKTVEVHLSRVYAKLGIRSRAELGRSFGKDRG